MQRGGVRDVGKLNRQGEELGFEVVHVGANLWFTSAQSSIRVEIIGPIVMVDSTMHSGESNSSKSRVSAIFPSRSIGEKPVNIGGNLNGNWWPTADILDGGEIGGVGVGVQKVVVALMLNDAREDGGPWGEVRDFVVRVISRLKAAEPKGRCLMGDSLGDLDEV